MHYKFELGLDRVASNDRPDFMPWEIDEYLNDAIWIFLKERYSIDRNKNGFEVNQLVISELSNLHIKSPELQPSVTPLNLNNGVYEVPLNLLGDNINGQYFRYLFLTKAEATISKNNCTHKVRVKFYQTDDRKNTFDEPDFDWKIVHGSFGRSNFITTPVESGIIADSMDVTSNIIDDPNLITERLNNDQLQSIFLDTNNSDGESQFEIIDVCVSYIKYPNRVFIGGYDHIDKHSTLSTAQIHCDIDEGFHPEIIKIAVALAKRDILSLPEQISSQNNNQNN